MLRRVMSAVAAQRSSRLMGRRCNSTTTTTPIAATRLDADMLRQLAAIFGEQNVSVATAVRQHHAHDESLHADAAPDAVVYPQSTDQIAHLLRLCNDRRIPVVPFGAGSGFEGGVNAVRGGITVDVSRHMSRVLTVNADDFDCQVEAGVTRKQLNNHLKDTGLWFPIDPGADASLGGMSATSASGTNAVRYGTMRENVLNLEVVLADGRVINTAGKEARSRKNVAGYNLTNLFVGSEGTLGVITKVALRLYAQPETITGAVAPFADAQSAVQATVEIMQTGMQIARIEFLDEKCIRANNVYNQMHLTETPTLFLEFQGSAQNVATQVEAASEICKQNACTAFDWASDADERHRLWQARHNSWFAFRAQHPRCAAISTDVCVPVSRLPDVLASTRRDIDELRLHTCIVGHVGDGNFHTFVALDTSDSGQLAAYAAYTERLVRHALAAGGTCTGEHGIGLGKRRFLVDQFGADACDLMRTIKSALDPNAILNPGKIL